MRIILNKGSPPKVYWTVEVAIAIDRGTSFGGWKKIAFLILRRRLWDRDVFRWTVSDEGMMGCSVWGAAVSFDRPRRVPILRKLSEICRRLKTIASGFHASPNSFEITSAIP
jgi:hypothetical protein